MRHRPLALFSFSFALAVVVSAYLLPAPEWTAFVCLVIGAGLGVVHLHRPHVFPALLAAVGLAAGFLWMWGCDALFVRPLAYYDGRVAYVSVRLSDYPEPTDYGYRVTGRFSLPGGRAASGLLYLNDGDEDEESSDAFAPEKLRPGDTLELEVKLKTTKETVPLWVYAGGQSLTGTQKSEPIVERAESTAFQDVPKHMARSMRDEIDSLFPEKDAGYIRGFLLGDTSGFTDAQRADFSDTGVSHIFALSGLHMAMLAGFILLFVRTPRQKRAAFWVVVPMMIVYAAVAGFPPSAVRAVIMQAFLLLSCVVDRDNDSITSLSSALLLILLLNPYAAVGVGLQLSFTATLGIVLLSDRFLRRVTAPLTEKQGFPARAVRYLLMGASVSCAALVFSAPLVALYFGTVSLISVLSNALILWAVSLCFPLGLVAALAGLLWTPLGQALALGARPLLWYMRTVVEALARLPYAALKTGNALLGLWFVFACMLVWVLLFVPSGERGRRKLMLPALLLVVSFVFSWTLSRVTEGQLEMVSMDVGRGQSVLLVSADATVLVNCGGSKGDVARHATDVVRGYGRWRIDELILTDFSEETAGAAASLLAQIPVGKITYIEAPDSELAADILRAARQGAVGLMPLTQAETRDYGALTIRLYNVTGYRPGHPEHLAVLTEQSGFTALITGQMDERGEHALLRMVELPELSLLVVGRMGAADAASQALLDRTHPKTAVLSSNANDRWNPSESTLYRLRDTALYRTDENGDVRVRVN